MTEGIVAPIDFRTTWDGAMTFEQFLAVARPEYQSLWQGVHRHAKAPAWVAAALAGRRVNLLAITEDWCMDTSNTLPFLARIAEAVPGVELRLLLRDANPDVMDRYLTNGSRSIPVVIVLDENFNEIGKWGPRPSELQAWVLANKDVVPKPERLKEQRRWYISDRGETTVREILASAGLLAEGS
jgi:hypothetical protein